MEIINLKVNTPSQILTSIVNPICYIEKGKQVDINYNEIKSITIKIIHQFFSGVEMMYGRPQLVLKSNGVSNIEITDKITNNNLSLMILIPCYIRIHAAAPSTKMLLGLQRSISEAIDLPVDLRMVMLNGPYLDPIILAEYVSGELSSNTFEYVIANIIKVINPIRFDNELTIPSSLIGVKIHLAGRLKAERTRPRFTTQKIEVGSFMTSKSTLNSLGSYTAANKKGSYTVRVWLNQLI